jgi:GTP-binding protein HflX
LGQDLDQSNNRIGDEPTRTILLQPVLRERGVQTVARDSDVLLEETAGLARAISLDLVSCRAVTLNRPRPATLFGEGVVSAVHDRIKAEDARLVIVGGPLTPVQQRNLERAWSCKVIDRTGLILEIFGERARTREGQLQVELAALTYQRSRLVRSWTHLERQRGGFGFVGGPGESQIELDRRMIDERIARLKKDLDQVKRTRGLHRQARERVPYPLIALVGYTNAGKSTLFNRLTRAEVFAEDMLFATLDPTMRSLELPSGRLAILSDTVGFISELPHDLVAAFRATLEEVVAADIILHVRDVADPDTEAQRQDVEYILKNLLAERDDEADGDGKPVLMEVLNKADLLDREEAAELEERAARSSGLVLASALKGQGCEELLEKIDAALAESDSVADIEISLSDGATMAWLYERGEVLKREDDGLQSRMTVRLAPRDLARFRKQQSQDAQEAHGK